MTCKKTKVFSLLLALLMIVSVLPQFNIRAQADDKEVTMYLEEELKIFADANFGYILDTASWSSNSSAVRIKSSEQTHCIVKAVSLTYNTPAVITCKYKEETISGSKRDKVFNCYVTVAGRDPTSIEITPSKVKTNPGVSVKLGLSLSSSTANSDLTWVIYEHGTYNRVSSDCIYLYDRGCTYYPSQRYVIKPKKSGSYDIFVTTVNDLTAMCYVVVVDPAVKLSKTKFVYNGKAKKPAVEYVKMYDGSVIDSDQYTVKYSKGRKNVGRHTVTVQFGSKYASSPYCWQDITKSFVIVPKGTKITKLTKNKKSFTVKWKKQKKQTTGYQIAYSRNKNFKKGTVSTVKVSAKKTSKKISKLKSKKKYFVKIRTYKKVKGKCYYSSWSKVKYVKTK